MMEKKRLTTILMTVAMVLTNNLMAQKEGGENPSKFSVGADVYSNYIWRGSKLGTGPAFQPCLEFATGGLSIGAWGSFDADGYAESDLYITYSFPFGLSFGVMDYYAPDFDFFDYSDSTGSHAIEITAGYEIKGFSLSANYILNEAGGIASSGGDIYFEAEYGFKYCSIFLGAGNGWHTSTGDFGVCNVGLGTTKEIKITDSFSIPVTGQVILNPEKEILFVVVGFSL